MADAILARLRGEVLPIAAAAVKNELEFNSERLSDFGGPPVQKVEFRPLNVPAQPAVVLPKPPVFQPPPITAIPNLPPPVQNNAPRPNSIKSSIEYFGAAAVDTLLGYHRESISNALALRWTASNIRRKRGAFIGFALLFMAGACGLSASPICPTDTNFSDNCSKTYLGTIAALCAGAAGCLSVSILISKQSAGALDSIASEWNQLGKTINEALYLSPPTGDSPSFYVRQWAQQHTYIASRTPPINSELKKMAYSMTLNRNARETV